METLHALAEFMEAGGPYAVTAIALFVAAHQYRAREALRREHVSKFDALRKENSELAEKITNMVAKLTEVVTQNNSTNDRMISGFDRMGEFLPLLKQLLDDLRQSR